MDILGDSVITTKTNPFHTHFFHHKISLPFPGLSYLRLKKHNGRQCSSTHGVPCFLSTNKPTLGFLLFVSNFLYDMNKETLLTSSIFNFLQSDKNLHHSFWDLLFSLLCTFPFAKFIIPIRKGLFIQVIHVYFHLSKKKFQSTTG